MLDDRAETAKAATPGLAVAQVAEATGVSGHTLRYYERAGLIHPITRTAGNQRRYQPDDLEWVKFLVRLRETGMPIAQIREYATLRVQGNATLPERRALLADHQKTVRRQIRQLRTHERALTVWVDNDAETTTGGAAQNEVS